MMRSLRRYLQHLTLFLGVILSVVYGPVEMLHSAAHAQAIATAQVHQRAQGAAPTDTLAAPTEACALCVLAALLVALPRVECLLHEPPTQPRQVCLVLSHPESLRLAAPCFQPLRAPPAPTC
ncbi:hypothetical protein [Armatimonas rosea]|uniref:DUF2946 domain-containing protein n=1 Tax=Armatimonas rosea TaxID=685828 RepID=A0A7W9W740_ARMRO|nr:hypothetical protein [Armatimonas rosea]MBB6050207.1 hypothetical protein [Armatimonas rosea]